jgi:hypothetical protein
MTSMAHDESSVKRARKVDPSTIPTEYAGWIGCAETIGGKRPSYCVGIVAPTIPDLVAEAFAEAARMVGIGHKPNLEGLTLQCATCHGSGDTALQLKSGRWTRKTCKACKGQGEFERFEPIALTLSRTVIICDDCMIGRD